MRQPEASRGPRRTPFRPVALARYERPLDHNSPELPARWRPGLIAAALIAALLALLPWLWG